MLPYQPRHINIMILLAAVLVPGAHPFQLLVVLSVEPVIAPGVEDILAIRVEGQV